MIFLKLACFMLVIVDTVRWLIEAAEDLDSIGKILGFLLGIAARAFVLYGTTTCWLIV